MKFVAGICAYFFPALLVLMEAVFRIETSADWSFAAPALAATSVSLLISSLRIKSAKRKESLGGAYSLTVASEADLTYVLFFVTASGIIVWGWVIHEASMQVPPLIFGSYSRPLIVSMVAYFVAQLLVSWKEAQYA
ncbi:hypothetical protein N0B51_13550 [Tsuneonella sp. YG55]|uniref:Uncharacterized protein n=1 Tax=Tsuneonella litorea TaxID=2976475 RepID=A0A9X2W2Z0_9SPHN|nr:hypothetical protein [Tsuneonella litorea]MCT2560003.1 hypothetical protein [Tsuneonella litorea]